MACMSPFSASAQQQAFVSVVGFADHASGTPRPHKRGVRRQRSLLSETLSSVQRCPSALSVSLATSKSSPSLQSLDGDYSNHASPDADVWPDDLHLASTYSQSPHSDSVSDAGSAMSQPQDIPYTTAAKARIDRAEQQGRARDEQLEMLQAVRAYMAARSALCQPRGC